MRMFINFFVVFCFAIAFANGAPVSSKSSNKYDSEIEERIDEATNLANDRLKANNADQGFLGSTLNDLSIFSKSLLAPQLIGATNVLPFLKDAISGALEGGSNGLKHGNLLDASFGILSGLASGATEGFQKVGAKIGKSVVKGSDPKENKIITKDFDEALKLALDKQSAQNDDRTDIGGDLHNVNNLVNLLLRFGTGLIAPYVTTALGSGIHGLIDGLTDGVHEHGLVGGVLDGVHGLFDGFAEGGISGFGYLFTNLLALPE